MVESKGKFRVIFNKTILFFLFLNFLVISIMLFNYYAFAHIKLNGDNLRAERKTLSSQIGNLMKAGQKNEAEKVKLQVAEINNKLDLTSLI